MEEYRSLSDEEIQSLENYVQRQIDTALESTVFSEQTPTSIIETRSYINQIYGDAQERSRMPDPQMTIDASGIRIRHPDTGEVSFEMDGETITGTNITLSSEPRTFSRGRPRRFQYSPQMLRGLINTAPASAVSLNLNDVWAEYAPVKKQMTNSSIKSIVPFPTIGYETYMYDYSELLHYMHSTPDKNKEYAEYIFEKFKEKNSVFHQFVTSPRLFLHLLKKQGILMKDEYLDEYIFHECPCCGEKLNFTQTATDVSSEAKKSWENSLFKQPVLSRKERVDLLLHKKKFKQPLDTWVHCSTLGCHFHSIHYKFNFKEENFDYSSFYKDLLLAMLSRDTHFQNILYRMGTVDYSNDFMLKERPLRHYSSRLSLVDIFLSLEPLKSQSSMPHSSL